MDRFKTYLRENAHELDTDLPRDQVWKKMEASLIPAASKPVIPLHYRRWLAAACIAALLGLLLWWVVPVQKNNAIAGKQQQEAPAVKTETAQDKPEASPATPEKDAVAKNTGQNENSSTGSSVRNGGVPSVPSPQENREKATEASMLHNLESSFIQIISLQLDKVRSTPLYTERSDYFSDFKKQFYQLDEDEQSLKKSIQHNGLSDDRMQALINIYQQKINVLKQLQNEINKTNKYYRKNQQPDNAAAPDFMNI